MQAAIVSSKAAATFAAIAASIPRPTKSGSRLRAGGEPLGHELLPRARGLPDLRELVPDVVGVEAPDRVRGPAADELGARGDEVDDVPPAQVVADEVDRLADPLELRGQPAR